MRQLLAPFVGSAAVVAALTVACGAEDKEAPPPPPSTIQRCRDFAALMPNFVAALNANPPRTANLRTVVENHLLKPLREGDAPPVNDVLRAVFSLLNSLALKPAEVGAPAGQYCAPTASPPPLTRANELCELRRSLDVLVHQGKGIDGIKLVEPQLTAAIGYITGRGRGADVRAGTPVPHWEIASIFSGMCAQDGNCQLSNGLDLVIALVDYSQTADGKLLADHLNALVSADGGSNALTGFLDPSALTETDTIAIVRTVVAAIGDPALDGPSLQRTIDSLPLPASTDGGPNLKADLQPVVDDLKKILGRPEIMVPTRRALTCLTAKDPNYDAVRMVYRLALRDKLPEFGLTRLVGVVQGIQKVDERGSLVFLAGTLAEAVRRDEQAIDSAASVCRTLLSNAAQPGQTQSNAQLALPVIGDLVQAGIIEEGICAVDTLLFGCTGGVQPACLGY